MMSMFVRLPHLLSIALVAGSALGQGALDAGLQVGSKTNTAAKQEDFRSRNLVVTGDVAAGRGFRGSVGYTAEGDFRGATAGDASVNFRRNAAFSNPVLAANSANAAASFNVGRDSMASLEYRRDHSGATPRGPSGSVADASATRVRLDRLSTQMTSSQQRLRDGEGTAMARYQSGEDETGTLVASTVRGVKRQRDRDDLKTAPLTLYESARLREDIRRGLLRMDAIGQQGTNPFAVVAGRDPTNALALRDVRAVSKDDQSARPVDTRVSGYDRIVSQMRQNWVSRVGSRAGEASASEDVLKRQSEEMGDAYDQLRLELGSSEARKARVEDKAKDKEAEQQVEGEKKLRIGTVKMSAEDFAAILKHGTTLDAFGDEGKDRIDELLRDGQRAMHEGNCFTAEKRFEVAMLIKPGDPRPLAGMLHCQIGANLAGSAAITLRSLLSSHPEMIDVRYGEQAVPPRARIERAMATTRERIARSASPVDDGLLLAYLGHLTGDRAAIQEGLSHVKGKPQDETLRQLLEKIWLAPDAKPGIEPAAASAP